MPLSCASASWLRPCTARSWRMFLARTSRSGPLCVRFTDAIMPIDGFMATAFMVHSNEEPVGWAKALLAPCPQFFESNVFALMGGHAAGRVRARRFADPQQSDAFSHRAQSIL